MAENEKVKTEPEWMVPEFRSSVLQPADVSDLLRKLICAVRAGDLGRLKAIRSAETESFKEHLRMFGGLLLFHAVQLGLYDIGDFLLANGCSLRRCFGMTASALHLAVSKNDASEFLVRLAEYSSHGVNVQDASYETPLHVACAHNNWRAVETLLSHGAEAFRPNSAKEYPLDIALAGGHVECVRLLLEHYANVEETLDASTFDEDFIYVYVSHKVNKMDVAAKYLFDALGHENVLKVLDSMHRWDQPRSSLILAQLESLGSSFSVNASRDVKCRLDCIDLLVKNGFVFNMLHLALKHLSDDYYFKAMVSLVEEYGASVNEVDDFHYTPLHVAVYRGDIEAVKYLLDRGAMVDEANSGTHGIPSRPLEVALKRRVINDAVVRLLVERGAQVNFINRNGWCPLKGALERHHDDLAQFLIDNGANVDIKNPATGLTLFFDLVFMTISRQYDTRVMRFLLEHGASLECESADGTPLHFIASVPSNRVRGCIDFMKLLIQYSGDINALDTEGNTPLMKAMKVPYHSVPMITLLLECGADPKVRNYSGQTALSLAITLRKVDAITLLMKNCVEYDPMELFSNQTVLLDSIIINMPYARGELFFMRSFLVRPDVTLLRQCFVRDFIEATSREDADLDDMLVCFHEHLRHSPIERSVLAQMTSGATVLFAEAEHHVLRTRLSKPVKESLLRGVLEYRMVLNDGISFGSACQEEIIRIDDHLVADDVTLSFLTLPEKDQLALLSRAHVRTALLSLVDPTRPEIPVISLFPIFGATLAMMIADIVAKHDMLPAATLFFNRCVSETSVGFDSMPQLIVDNIFGYLTVEDLKNVMFLDPSVAPRSLAVLKKRWKITLTHFLKNLYDQTKCLPHPTQHPPGDLYLRRTMSYYD